MNPAYRQVWPIFAVFFCQSAVLGSWIPRIPDIKDQYQLTDATLGLCLLAIPLGTIIAFLWATRLLRRPGLRNGCRIWVPVWALLFFLPALFTHPLLLVAALLMAGFALGICEVAMNTKADYIEKVVGFRIMSRCHGCWSLGSMAGALTGSAFAHAGFGIVGHYLSVLPVLALAAYIVATALPVDAAVQLQEPAPTKKTFTLPPRALLALCALPLGIMVVEGVFIDWSALFMRDVLNASPLVIGITYTFFSVVMALTRLSGDAISAAVGDSTVVLCSGIAATLGLALFASATSVGMAMAGAMLAGLGVAIVYPLTMSAAARRPGVPTDNVAALSLIAFVAFLLAPPVIGFLSSWFGLRVALLLLLPIVALTPVLFREVER